MGRKRKHLSYDGSPVGYKKPPAEHQFKKGQRRPEGSGRKAGSQNCRTLVAELLDEEVSVSLGGQTQRMSRRKFMIWAGWEKAIKGASIRDLLSLLSFFEKLAPGTVDPPEPLLVESMPGDGDL